jgi:uncharacterized membrane protein
MNPIQIIAALTAGVGLLIFALAIPLFLRRVPPNDIYGVRTKASFASESDWYRINFIGGRYLMVSGLVILIVGVIGFFVPMPLFRVYSIGAGVVTVLAVLGPCVRLCLLKSCQSSRDHKSNMEV